MVYRGHVENGLIRLENSPALPEGLAVEVRLLEDVRAPTEHEARSLYERLRDVVGKAEGLPEDLAANHDHYLHGREKQ